MTENMFSISDKALVLRFSRLGRLPPALYATEILHEAGVPVIVLEFGNVKESESKIAGSPPRIRWDARWVRFIPSPLHPICILLTTLFRLFQIIQNGERPKLTISHGPQENFICFFLYQIFHIPYVVQVHEVYDKSEIKGIASRLLFSLERSVLSHAKFLIFPEEERRKLYTERYQLKAPSYLVPNCPRKMGLPSRRELKKDLGLAEDSVLMAYVGGISDHNLIEDAIKAIAPLTKVCFLLWGWGAKSYLEEIKALAKSLGVEKRVLLMGELKENKWELIAGADLSYCVYRMDLLRMKLGVTASNKLFESMACGVAVLAPPTFSFVTEKGVGLTVPSLDVEGIRSAVKTLSENSALRKTLGANGRKCVETTYYYEKQFEPVLNAFKALFNKKEPSLYAA